MRHHLNKKGRELINEIQRLPEGTPCARCKKNQMIFILENAYPEDVDLPHDGNAGDNKKCVPQVGYDGVKLCWGERVLRSGGVKKYSFVYKMVNNEFKAKIIDLKTPAKKYAFLREGQTINP